MTIHYHAGETINSIFIEQPDPLNLCDLNGETIFLQWIAQYEPCDHPTIFVQTLNYVLYPTTNDTPPTEIRNELNSTVNDGVCTPGKKFKRINVSLSMHLNEHILEHVPYIECAIIRRAEERRIDISEKLYLKANTNCFSTTQSTDVTRVPNPTTVETLEPSPSPLVNYASCVLHCHRSFVNIISYYVMCVFVTISLAVLKL